MVHKNVDDNFLFNERGSCAIEMSVRAAVVIKLHYVCLKYH